MATRDDIAEGDAGSVEATAHLEHKLRIRRQFYRGKLRVLKSRNGKRDLRCRRGCHTCASMLFEGGKSIRRVAACLGHADPAFTLRTHVHLLDDGLGGAEFLDDVVGKGWARQHPETAGNAPPSQCWIPLKSTKTWRNMEEPQAAASAASSS